MRLAIVGAGAVGTAVAELAGEYGHTVTGLADSSSGVVDGDGVDVDATLERKRSEGTVGADAPDDVLQGPYDVLVEATPTTLGDAEPGFGHVRTALERDRHAVLANKGPVAERYGDVRALEAESAGDVLFEATVGGAIPVLSTIADVGADNVSAVRGVLNGTANFVLSRMAAEGLSYEHVLAEAQDLGVAEADPSFDVEVSGIRDLQASALDLATEAGQTIRLIGEVSGGDVRVGPRLVPEHGTLAVGGTRNIVQLETAHAGRLNISGRGAGGPETASAVLADVGRLGE
ncbi:homoserine dehydrogenase [Halobacteriales archaeon QH_7_66_37]|nr:MAG: homoserine dehydrogenase [Halobacteriales archaeon QH_7_66_37]